MLLGHHDDGRLQAMSPERARGSHKQQVPWRFCRPVLSSLGVIGGATLVAVLVCSGLPVDRGAFRSRLLFCVPQGPGRPKEQRLLQSAAAVAHSGIGVASGRAAHLGQRPRRKALPEALILVTSFVEAIPERVAGMGSLGAIYFFCIYVLAECLAIPATPLTLSAGYLFGGPMGVCIALLAGSTAAGIGFLLSRTFLRPVIVRMAEKRPVFKKINKAVEREGFKIVLLMRLSPLLPFSIANYLFGLSNVRFTSFMAASLLGFAPGTCTYVYLATTARVVVSEGARAPWYYYVLGVAGTAVLVRLAARIAKRAVDEAVEDGAAALQPATVGS